MTQNNRYHQFRLDNGLFVVLQNTPTRTVYGKLRMHSGALSEKKGEQGLAHLLEHVIVNGGTKKYSISKTDKIRNMFSEFNAVTNHIKTKYHADFLSEDLDLFLDYLSNTVFNPRFDPKKVDEEKRIVIREINGILPNHNRTKKYYEALMGKARNYFVGGDEEIIKRTTIKNLREFHSREYGADNADLILVGALPKNTEKLIRKYFESAPSGNAKPNRYPPLGPLKKRKIVRVCSPSLYNPQNPEKSCAELFLGMRMPGFLHEDHSALAVLSSILGGDSGSRIFKGIREKRGLAYIAGSDYSCSENSGTIHIYTKISAKKEEEAIAAIFDEMRKLKRSPVNSAELERIKRGTKYVFSKKHETNEGHVESIETKLDRGLDIDDTLSRINAVTLKDVFRVARKYLPDRDGNYVLMVKDPLKST